MEIKGEIRSLGVRLIESMVDTQSGAGYTQ